MLTSLPRSRMLAALGALLLVAACSKDKASPTPVNSWQVDGQLQKAANVTVEVGTPTNNPNTLTIDFWQSFASASSNGSAVAITLRIPSKVGTYSLTSTTTSASASYADYVSPGSGSDLYLATSGSITISALTSNSVVGTFSFTGAELFNTPHTKQIASGQFNTKF